MADAEGPQPGHVHLLLPGPSVHARGVPRGAAIATARPTLDELLIADPPARWAALGFAVGEDGACDVGPIRLQLGAGGGEGIVGWALRGVRSGPIDGLATIASGAPPRPPAPAQPNGAIGVDHVVVATPDLERTLAALADAGLEVRRVRDAGARLRQAFYVIGDALLEVAGPSRPDPGVRGRSARFWGLTLVVEDLDATCARLGGLAAGPRDAVQPGRRIATVRESAGLGTRLALMTPRPGRR